MFAQFLRPTLVKRVVLTLLLALAVLWLVLMAYYFWQETASAGNTQRQAERGALVLAEFAKIQDAGQAVRAASLYSSLFNGPYIRAGVPQRFVLQLSDQAGRRLFITKGADHIQLTGSNEQIVSRQLAGTQYAVFRGEAAPWVVHLAEPAPPSGWMLARISSNLTMSVLIAVPLLLLPVWWAVRRGLSPLRELSHRIAKRGPDDLSPLQPGNIYAELAPLTEALNRLFSQLQAKVAREQSFVQDAAHELRTPIAVMSAQAHVLAKASDHTERQAAAKHLEGAIARVSHLIEQLLDLARIDSWNLTPTAPLDVAGLVRQELANATPFAMQCRIELSLDAPDILLVHIYVNPLQSIIQNLLSNALRYGRPGGYVWVELAQEDDCLILSVADDGPGIPESARELVFERFYRVNGTDVAGSGLGLAIVAQAVRRLSGTVQLGPGLGGQGCKFTIQLPLHPNGDPLIFTGSGVQP